MGLYVSPDEVFAEAQEMALYLRFMERRLATARADALAQAAQQAAQIAGAFDEDGDPAGAAALRWFAAHLTPSKDEESTDGQ